MIVPINDDRQSEYSSVLVNIIPETMNILLVAVAHQGETFYMKNK